MRNFLRQYEFNVNKGPLHEDEASLPESTPGSPPARLIAYYLPQFHQIPENSAWWGPGFTEWSNTSKALPRYLGHQQPNMPADLGFYDLSQADTIRRQADLARRGGIYGFCIHHYWFSGREILQKPLSIILSNTDINLRFCLNWANENWTRRWEGGEQNVLLKQTHNPETDFLYAESILPALRDSRYIRINGRPVIMLYRPNLLPNPLETMKRWRKYFVEQGVGEPYLVMPQAFGDNDPRPFGMDAAVGFPPHAGGWDISNDRESLRLLDSQFQGGARSYNSLMERTLQNQSAEFTLHPGVCPRWDNEARRPGGGASFYGSTPAIYGSWLNSALKAASDVKNPEERLVFINAWNEWAEGAYLEPDRHFGYAYLAETRRVLDGLMAGDSASRSRDLKKGQERLMLPRRSTFNRVRNALNMHRVKRKIINTLSSK